MLWFLTRWLAPALILAGVTGLVVVRASGDDPARWHVDPAQIPASNRSNDFLAAPAGTTMAAADMETPTYLEGPRDLLERLDAIARSQPRTSVVAGDAGSLMITYVQRSRFIGFPDYLTVRAVAIEGDEAEGGAKNARAGLIVYSRSRYGRSDFGVNRARVEAWLTALGLGS